MATALVRCQPPLLAVDNAMQHVLWAPGEPPPTPRAQAPIQAEPLRRTAPLGVEDSIRARGAALHEFYLRQALSAQEQDCGESGGLASKAAASEEQRGDGLAAELARRPPEGSGYRYPAYRGKQSMTLAERFRPTSAGRQASQQRDSASAPASARQARRERIKLLEEGLLAHDEERLRGIADGTRPLQFPGGEPMIPVPPLEPKVESRIHVHQRLHMLSMHRSSKETVRDLLISAEILGKEAADRPPSPVTLARLSGSTAARHFAKQDEPSSPSSGGNARLDLSLKNADAMVLEAEALVQRGANEDQWLRLAAQLSARAYKLEVPDVLRMVRVLGAALRGSGARTASGKKELLRAADHMIQSLTARLQDATLDVLLEVIETMSDAGVGTQAYLDMLMATILARHHRDCHALDPPVVFRLATALGRVAAPSGLRLRPKGVGGPSTTTNLKLMDAIEQRIISGLGTCGAEDLARLDDYYVTRLCSDRVARCIVIRSAELQVGLRDATKHYLALAVRLQEAIQRELPESFRWSLPRPAREYLEQLRILGLRDKAPWALGDFSAVARSRMNCWKES